MTIPLSQPDITEHEIEAVTAVLRSSRLSLGPKLAEFEQRVASYAGVPHGIGVSSGTAGLHLCVRALELGPGDEVLVPSFTFIAAANAIRYEGATPVFVDIEPETLNMDAARVEEAITPRTRALMMVHTFGCPADVDALLRVARRHGLRVIEDACEALGATWRGQPAGSFGDAAVFAFYPNKQITTGEGGVVVTRDAELAKEMRAMRNQGRYDTDAWHQHSVLGFNYRLSEINAALGVAQMDRMEEILRRREMVAARYGEMLGAVPKLTLPVVETAEGRTSWFVYVVRLGAGDDGGARRDAVLGRMGERGIQCGRYFAPVHQQPAYRGWALPQALPVTEVESLRTLALPFFTAMTEEQISTVAGALGEALG